MRNRTLLLCSFVFVLALGYCATAYAGGDACPVGEAWTGFWNSVGGFLYNALPWNWSSWAGK